MAAVWCLSLIPKILFLNLDMKKNKKEFLPESFTKSSLVTEVLTMAVNSLWSNKLRTGLTMLGIIIGISSVVGVTSIGQGVKQATEKQIQSLGSDVILVLAGAASSGGISQGGDPLLP